MNLLIFKMLLLPALVLFGSPKIDDPVNMTKVKVEVSRLLDEPNLANTGIVKEAAIVHLEVNQKTELVVVQVDTDSKFVDQYLKTRLNYQKLQEDVSSGRYVLKVIIQDGGFKI